MRIFITGGTGFLGQHTLKRLSTTSHTLRCLVRTGSERRLRVNGILTDTPEQPLPDNLEIVPGHVLDADALRTGMKGCDALIHLANVYTMWERTPGEMARVNVEGTRLVLQTALELGIAKVVYVSTIAVYGKPRQAVIREETPHGPRQFSAYGRSKAEAERIAWQFYAQGLPLTVLYPGIVLGPGDDKPSGVYIRDFIEGRIPTPIFRRSYETYTAVGDVAEAVVRALELPHTVGQKYLIGKEQLNGMEYARMICQAAGVRMPWMRLPDFIVIAAAYLLTARSAFTHQPPPWGLSVDAAWTLFHGFRYDGSKAERELGLHYTPVLDALRAAVQWYRRFGAR